MLIIEPEPDGVCSYCGAIAETRPYGKDGAEICYDCGMKPENREQTDMAFYALLDSLKPINPNSN